LGGGLPQGNMQKASNPVRGKVHLENYPMDQPSPRQTKNHLYSIERR